MTVNVYLIPLSNIPQVFLIDLAGVTYSLTAKWNDSLDAGWTLDLADQNSVPIASNIPCITGADLLDGLDYLGIEGQFFIYTNGQPDAVPTLDNLGTDCNLYFQTSVTDG